jgi:GntR family transcriptional regulator, transcriptional repressor for pyruvate dehydrogenase complex
MARPQAPASSTLPDAPAVARRDRLADQVYGRLLEDIVAGGYEVGDRLPAENDLALAFAVSRPVVREALTRLAADGLVSARQGAGTFIARVPPRQIVKLAPRASVAGILRVFEARIALEGQAARLAAERRSAAELAEIGRALEAMREAMQGGKPAAAPDFAFHRAVAVATGNRTFVDILESLAETISTGMNVALGITRQGSRLRTARVIDEHVRIYEAIAASEPDSAELAMRYHLDQSRKRLTDRKREA